MENAPWYYVSAERQRQGPVPVSALRELFAAGTIGPRSLVWRQGMPQWQPLEQVAAELGIDLPSSRPPAAPPATTPAPTPDPETTRVPHAGPTPAAPSPPSPPSPPPPRPPETEREAGPQLRDAAVEQAYAARVGADPQATDVVHDGGDVVYAGFLKRFAANFVDSLIVGIVGGVIGGIIGAIFSVALIGSGADPLAGSLLLNGISMLIGLALGLLYYGGFHSSSSQATPGKMLIGIKVARGAGERLTGMRACGRFLATYLNLLTLGIGWLMAGFTERKRALHDFICDTVVVDRWAYTEFPERQNRSLGGCAIAILVLCGLFVLFGVGIMAAVALPAYNDYTQRAKLADAIGEASSHRLAIAEFRANTDRCPATPGEAGLQAPSSALVQSVEVGELDDGRCTLRFTLGGAQAGILDGEHLWFTLNGKGAWTCGGSMADRYLPASCRG